MNHWYKSYHKHPAHKHAHWGAFLAVALLTSSFLIDQINQNYSGFPDVPRVEAASSGACGDVGGVHSYFETLRRRSDAVANYCLRDAGQIEANNESNDHDVTYDYTGDPDPRKQDAAKVVVPYDSVSLPTHVRLPTTVTGGTMLLTWDAWFGQEFAWPNTSFTIDGDTDGITNYKNFQIASGRIWTEVRSRFFLGHTNYPGSISLVDVRQYGGNGPDNAPAVWKSINYGGESLGPRSGEFNVKPQKWTRYWARFVPDTAPYYRFTLWVADEDSPAVKIIDGVQISPNIENGQTYWDKLWLEYNTSSNAIPPARGPLVGYFRNAVVLAGGTYTDAEVASLLQQPSGRAAPSITPPSVTLTPSTHTIPGPGSSLNMTASVTDTDGINRVEFYYGIVGLKTSSHRLDSCTTTSAPYTCVWSNIPASSNPYLVSARAYDNKGNSASSNIEKIVVGSAGDITPPTVSVTLPKNGEVLSGQKYIDADANDNYGVSGVQFKIDGVNKGDEDVNTPFHISWSTLLSSNGPHVITAVARDVAGHLTTSAPVTVTVSNTGNSPPSVAITSPVGGASFSAPASITINANAADTDGTITKVEFYNSNSLLNTDTVLPYSYTWPSVGAGSYTLKAKAFDNAGASITSDAVKVTVTSGTTVTANISASPATIPSGNSSTLTWSSTNAASCTASGAWSGSKATSGTQVVTPTATATYTITCTGASGSANKSVTVTVTAPDTAKPTVAITSPTSGLSISGTVDVAANASDNVAVVGVQFKLDGANLGGEDTSEPYIYSWNTVPVSAGTHTLSAVARDAAGNTGVASNISVIITDPGPDSPTLSFNAAPPTIKKKESSKLLWNSDHTTSCTASGGWSGTKALSGSENVSPEVSTTYTLTCAGPGGSVVKSEGVTVASDEDRGGGG
ncbi:hypothetical protein KW807_00555, partial [Candidatus Parcubacteria bacterium]|nr:hypothetical protein [Candidatus Parcubacteria bacterium]